MREYAVPRFFSGTIFDTVGHRAAGTMEYPTPRIAMPAYPKPLTPSGAKAMMIWAMKTRTDPAIIHLVPLPTLSTSEPKSGAKITVENGIRDTIRLALSAGRSNLGINIDVANFLNDMMLQ